MDASKLRFVIVTVVAFLGLVVAIVIALAGGTNGHADGGRPVEVPPQLVAPAPPHSPLHAEHAQPALPAAADPNAAADADELQLRRIERVSRALELLRFPPDSQPLTASMHDVLHPGARHETPLPISGEVSLLFTASSFTIAPGTPVVATLEAIRGKAPDQRRRAAVEVRGCTLSRFAQPDYQLVAPSLPLNDEGRAGDTSAGDRVYSLTVPASLPGLAAHNGLIRLDAEVVVEGEPAPTRVSLDFRLTSAAPATFLGVARERLSDDGLEIAVDLRVQRAGRYFVQGLLFDAADRPIGVAVARASLEAGSATVPLLYWGLLFHEAAAVAPFTFRTLTGHRLPDAGEAEGTDMETWSGTYRTRSYGLSELSGKEYESAGKTRKVQALGDLVRPQALRR